MRCVSTKFGVDSSSRFSFRARTQTHEVADAADHRTHASATVGVVMKVFVGVDIRHVSVTALFR